jgi:predicted N-acetyltransferase YhbS
MTTIGCSILERSPRACEPCSSAATGRDVGLGRAILESCERAARAEGFTNLVLGATLPGEPLYRSFGFRPVERFQLTMPDGVSLDAVVMERPIETA